MSTHTPGPWVITQATGAIHAVRAKTEARPYGPVICDVGFGDTHEINVANAALIAAAPDLLDALCRLLDDSDEHLTLQGRKNLARAAIAKATGDRP